MNQIGWRLLQIVVFLVLASPARAESAKLVDAEYYLIDSKSGDPEFCGIAYATTIDTLKGQKFVISGTITATFGGPRRIPIFFIMVRASQITNKVKPIKLKHAELRFGSHDTSKFAQVPDENPNALLLIQYDPNVALEWMQIVDRVNEGFWITAVGIGLNATFKAPPFSDEDLETYRGFTACKASALKKYQETARAGTVAVDSWACLDQEAFWAVLKELKEHEEVGKRMLVKLVEMGECRWLVKSETITVKEIDEKTGSICIVPTGETLCYWTANSFIVR